MQKPKIIVILGPTSSGKSDLAVKLAQKFNGEVISADSRQVYKGLNIGTGKITKKEMKGVKHHLLDIANPRKKFTVSDFVKATNSTVVKIVARGKIPILCGGTAFYIDALLGDRQIPEVPINEKLRAKLERKSVEELFAILSDLDPERAKSIDRQNPRRLVRAIEICKALGSVPKQIASSQSDFRNKFEILKIGTKIDEAELRNRINKRLEKRLKQGMIAEAKGLHARGLTYKRMRELGLEYGALADLLENKITKEEMVARLQKEIWHYAKRQMTWWKKDQEILWIKPSPTIASQIIKEFLRS